MSVLGHNTAMEHCNQNEHLSFNSKQLQANEKRTFWVVILTFVTMTVEIAAGYLTGSMALLADGWHMASHAAALTLTLIVYKLARSKSLQKQLSFGTGKLLPLGGYTSALGLGVVALFMAWESINRFLSPVTINFNEAIIVAVVGLIVNVISVYLLQAKDSEDDHDHHDHHHDHSHSHSHGHDHNHQSALVHVMADALTSIAAIIALVVGKYQGFVWLDPMIGVVGSILILKWAYKLLKDTAWELLDGHAKDIDFDAVKNDLESNKGKVTDLHIWRVGPHMVAVQAVVEAKELAGIEFYRDLVLKRIPNAHINIEENLI